MLECVEHDPPAADGTLIWLHGLGADGNDFAPIVPALNLPIRYVFPHAPVRPVTMNGGVRMRAWFDLYGLSRDLQVDEAGIAESRAAIGALITREVERGVPASRIVVGGFSQGGTMTLATALSHPEPLAGIVCLSAWMPAKYAAVADAQRDTPVFLGHGTYDPVVDVTLGRETHAALSGLANRVEFHEYPIQHGVSDAVLADLRAFLARAFS